MRTTVNLNEKLLKKAKKLAKERNLSLGQLIESSLLLSLSKPKKKKAKPKAFRLVTVEGELLGQNIDLDRSSEIIVQEDEDEYQS